MKIQRVSVSGFRGFREKVDIQIASGFTVIDGRNGVGKSTIFDAVEYVLTGEISKYGDQKANGQDVQDYVWWQGQGSAPDDRFVEVEFVDNADTVLVRRTPVEAPPGDLIAKVTSRLVDQFAAPPEPLDQLCATSIIRDENIASLSLDLTETQRYAKLRQAIGASDADAWVERGKKLLAIAKKASEAAKVEVASANSMVSGANRQLDEARALIAPDEAVDDAANRVAESLGIKKSSPDLLASQARMFVARTDQEIGTFENVLEGWDQYERIARDRAELLERQDRLTDAKNAADKSLAELGEEPVETASDLTVELVNRLHEIRQLGQDLSPVEGHCPLCAADHDERSFEEGFQSAGEIIGRLGLEANRQAEELARRKAAFKNARAALLASQEAEDLGRREIEQKEKAASQYLAHLEKLGFAPGVSKNEVEEAFATLEAKAFQIKEALRLRTH